MQAPKNTPPGTVVILPLERLSGNTTVKRGRGRPRKIELRPSLSQEAYVAAVNAAREKAVATDPVVVALQAGYAGPEALHAVKVAMAQEVAALGAVRREHAVRGLDVSQLASRRVAALGMLANIVFEITKLGGDGIDLRSDRMRVLFELFVKEIEDVAVATLPPDVAARFLERYRQVNEGWEDRIQLV